MHDEDCAICRSDDTVHIPIPGTQRLEFDCTHCGTYEITRRFRETLQESIRRNPDLVKGIQMKLAAKHAKEERVPLVNPTLAFGDEG